MGAQVFAYTRQHRRPPIGRSFFDGVGEGHANVLSKLTNGCYGHGVEKTTMRGETWLVEMCALLCGGEADVARPGSDNSSGAESYPESVERIDFG